MDNEFLNPTTESFNQDPTKFHTVTAPWSSRWIISETTEAGIYTIQSNYNDLYLSGSSTTLFDEFDECHGEFTITQPWDGGANRRSQYWKIIALDNGNVRIINDWEWQNSLVASSIDSNNSSNEFVATYPNGKWPRQQWKLETLGPGFSPSISNDLFPVPNEADTSFSIDFSSYPEGVYSVILFDMYSNKLIEQDCSNKLIAFDTSHIADGLYYLHIFNGRDTIKKQLVIKH